MFRFLTPASFALLSASLLFAQHVSAHGIETKRVTLPPIKPGASLEVVLKCSNGHYVLSGGVQNHDQTSAVGPLKITASYPKTTRSWAVAFSNGSGRPTGAKEVTATIYAMCGYRH